MNSINEKYDYEYAVNESFIVSFTDIRGIILYVNDNFCNISKYSREELMGSDHRIINSGYHSKEYIKSIWETISNGNIWHGELKNKTKDGNFYWVNTTIVPFLNMDGKPYKYLAIRYDITDRKNAEEKILEYRNMVINSNDLICTANLSGYFEEVNPQFTKTLGYTKEELISNKFMDFIHPDDIKSTTDIFENITTSGDAIVNFTNRYKCKNGEWVWLDWNSTIDFGSGKIYAIARDITSRKIIENRLADTMETLKHINKELEAFSYSVSHDLRAPLRAISGYSEMLLSRCKNKLDGSEIRLIDVIKINSKIMGDLIDGLLQFSRLGRKEISVSVGDMRDVVDYIISLNNYPRESITIKKLHKSLFDYELIGHVWSNFISNSIKYASGDRKLSIEIGSKGEGDKIIYYIRDNGIGFDIKFSDKIFEVFGRLHNSDYEGSGIGLSVAKRIINKHGGKVWVESEQGKGSCFYFTLKKINK